MATARPYLATRDRGLVDWAVAFLANLAAHREALGVPEAAVADYEATLAEAQQSLALATDQTTRTRPVVARKTADLARLRSATRALVRQIQARPETSDQQRRMLNITVPNRRVAPHGAPDERPRVAIASTVSRTLALKIRRWDDGRGRPAGCLGANVYYGVGPIVPTSPRGWTHAGQATTMNYQMTLPDDVPAGATVWVAANWYTARGQVGPLSDALSTNLPGGQARTLG